MRVIVGLRLPPPPITLQQGVNRDGSLRDFLETRRREFVRIQAQVLMRARVQSTRSPGECPPLACPNLGVIVLQVEPDEAIRISELPDVQWIHDTPDVGLLLEETGAEAASPAVTSQALVDLKIPDLWAVSEATGTIGHIDTGVLPTGAPAAFENAIARFNRFDECGRSIGTSPSDENGHGTLTAALLIARPHQGWQLGTAPRFQLVSAALPVQTVRLTYSFAAALDWCVAEGCRVISASVGKPGMRDAMRDIIVTLNSLGVILVAPAGNDAADHTCYPGNFPESVSVGSCYVGGFPMAENSSYGSAYGENVPDLVAPGCNVLSIGLNGVVVPVQGTCFATPLIAGTLAILAGSFPRKPIVVIRDALFESCTVGLLEPRKANRGLPNAKQAYDRLASMP